MVYINGSSTAQPLVTYMPPGPPPVHPYKNQWLHCLVVPGYPSMTECTMPRWKKTPRTKRSKFIDDAASEASDCSGDSGGGSDDDEETLEDRNFINDDEEEVVEKKRSRRVHISDSERELDEDDHALVLETVGALGESDHSSGNDRERIWKDTDEEDYDSEDAGFIVSDEDEEDDYDRPRKSKKNKHSKDSTRFHSRRQFKKKREDSPRRRRNRKEGGKEDVLKSKAVLRRRNARVLVSDGSENEEISIVRTVSGVSLPVLTRDTSGSLPVITTDTSLPVVTSDTSADASHSIFSDASVSNDGQPVVSPSAPLQKPPQPDVISHMLKDHFYDGYAEEDENDMSYLFGAETAAKIAEERREAELLPTLQRELSTSALVSTQQQHQEKPKLAHIFVPGSNINKNQVFKKVPSTVQRKQPIKKQQAQAKPTLPPQSGIYVRKDGTQYYMGEDGVKEERGMLYDD